MEFKEFYVFFVVNQNLLKRLSKIYDAMMDFHILSIQYMGKKESVELYNYLNSHFTKMFSKIFEEGMNITKKYFEKFKDIDKEGKD